jgi:hypothetical protein
MKIYESAILGFFFACAVFPASAVQQRSMERADSLEWNFDVYLDDSRVGYHNFTLEQHDDQQILTSEARFKVRLLFLTLYRYQHENAETWQGDCLQSIESRTNANGRKFSVIGSQGPEAFEVEATGIRSEVQGCVKTFAYWNPEFLEESALMNPQTGEVLPISVESLSTETYTARGQDIEASRFRLRAKGLDLDLWYSKDRQWLGLQSTTKDGRKIRYELT